VIAADRVERSPKARNQADRPEELCRLASEFAETHSYLKDPVQASGECFSTTMCFAWHVSNYGQQVEVVRWRLVGEDFSDHWAVVLSDDHVIDFTRVQVDGHTALFWKTSTYPASYIAPRRYPASLLLPSFKQEEPLPTGRYSRGYLAYVKATLAAFDDVRYPPPPTKLSEWLMLGLAIAFFGWRCWCGLA